MWREEATGTVDEVLVGDGPEGICRTLLVEGPSGCGRSSLIDTVIERATAVGAVVLSAIGFAGERSTPLSVLRQLTHRSPQLLPGDGARPVAAARVEDMQHFCRAVDALGSDAPVVICVDDAHHADQASLDHLQYLARHVGRARLLIVVAVPLQEQPTQAAFLTELMRRPGFCRVTLGPLSRETAADVARSAGHGTLAGPLYELSGGNPLLLRALLDECPGAAQAAPRPGGPYAMAVAACLHRSGPGTVSVAQACALLGPHASAERAARMLDLPVEDVRRALTSLEAGALLAGGRPRHPVAQEAILTAVSTERRAELHRRAARVLRADGCPAGEVAGHLLAAGGPAPAPDAEHLRTLRDAAEDLLAEDDAAGALRLLELARRCCPDGTQRTAVDLRLAQVSWRLDPAAAEVHLDTLLLAGQQGRLDPSQAQPLAQLLMAQGRCADLAESARSAAPAGAPVLPPLGAATGDTVPASEHLLRSARLTEATLLPVWQALFSLTHSARPQRALPWTRRLLDEAERRRAPGWQAAFAELHAQALLRTGELAGAVEFAERALAALSGTGRAPFAYSARAVLVRAHDALGHYNQAAQHLDAPPPPTLLRTRHGLAFLHARGHHHLTSGQPHPALADFLEVGRLMQEWHIDQPAYLPWRTDAAEALLRLGHGDQAARLAEAQLALPGAQHPWVHGQALRVQALSVAVPQRRAALLTQALGLLQQSGDRLATARTMVDLAQLHAPKTPARATHLEAAWQLAQECGAAALAHDILPVSPARTLERLDDSEAAAPRPASGETRLTASEQRVATLAAQGLTNREISAKLYLTVSTVEQHLTRVYRKLHITSRRDLPLQLTPLTPTTTSRP
ncbi:AAA family ATPase [Streptomyces sp. NPDC050085]|uniref:helix-turn-helix transcriptional regulator n=1 Tax=Streptomyces sp. NPDC050085 TaxID=3365600 RepID=UPI00379715CF